MLNIILVKLTFGVVDVLSLKWPELNLSSLDKVRLDKSFSLFFRLIQSVDSLPKIFAPERVSFFLIFSFKVFHSKTLLFITYNITSTG